MNPEFKEITWPPTGFIYDQEFMLPAFCKPKLCPLKSITLEKLEKMQRESVEKLKEMQQAAELIQKKVFKFALTIIFNKYYYSIVNTTFVVNN